MRTREAINASLAFSLAILVLFSFAFDPGNSDVNIKDIAGGCCGWCTPSRRRWR